MKVHLPVSLDSDLKLAIGGTSIQITPTAGLRLAEKLLKASARKMVQQETEQALRSRATPTARKPARR